jgi:glycosyltransferase involved in cell wall biosynthesis
LHIIHFSSVHPANDIRIYHKECKSLAMNGYDVSFVVKETKNKRIGNINIIAIKTQKNRFKRLFIASKEVYLKVLESGAMICHFHDPELIPVGILLRLKGKQVVYDVHEDLPRQILSKDWINPIFRYPISWLASLMEWFSSRFFFSAIIPATPKIAARFPLSKVALVQNYPKLNEFKKRFKIPWVERKKQIAYIGGITETRGIIENINALGLLHHENIRMVLAGPFSNKDLEDRCKLINGWNYVEYHPWLKRNEVMKVLSQSIAGLVVLHPTSAYIDSLPIKMFEYMLAGIPVIASDFPLWREIIEGNNCGILVDPLKPEKTAEAIEWIIKHPIEAEKMGKNGYKAVLEKYNWLKEETKLLQLYKKLST